MTIAEQAIVPGMVVKDRITGEIGRAITIRYHLNGNTEIVVEYMKEKAIVQRPVSWDKLEPA